MRHYCTLFDQKYLPQGLALYDSLKRHSSEPFMLHILALDDPTQDVLSGLSLPEVTMIAGEAFEADCGLEAIHQARTHQEWCWMLASQLCEFLFVSGLFEVTYLDADTFFFADPAPVFAEIGMRSIAITPHRLIPSKKYLEVNGLFNVGFVHFKNTRVGHRCVATWAAQCRTKCSATDGCGDQKYLDVWPEAYGPECCVIENIGVNAGPWSIANWRVTAGPRLDGASLICYHAHEFDAQQGRLTHYALRPEDRESIYEPYLLAYKQAQDRIASVHLQTR